MMLKKFSYFLTAIALFLASFLVVRAEASSTNYKIWADVLSTGGEDIASTTNYKLWQTFGEAIIDTASSTNYGSKIGFQHMVKDPFITLNLSTASVNFGDLSANSSKTTSHTMTVSTDAKSGFSVAVAGNTLTCSTATSCATQTIRAIDGVSQSSLIGSAQFGLNVVNPTGSAPIGSTMINYNDSNKYLFQSGDIIAQATSAINDTTYTVNYLANITDAIALSFRGTYTTSLTFTATGNF